MKQTSTSVRKAFAQTKKAKRGLLAMVTALLILSVLAVGCSKSAGIADGNLFQIPWPDENGTYNLQKVSVLTYDQPHALQGRYVHLYVDPYVTDGHLDSATPNGRYIRNGDGVYIPADFVSLQAAAIHAHYERLSALTESSGVHLNWPVKIGVQANVTDKNGSVRNNAIFDSQLDALLVVPYSDKSLPIAVNGGILAHEHFHMIFQSLVLSHLDSEKDPVIGKPGSLSRILTGACNIAAPVPGKVASDEAPTPTDPGQAQKSPGTSPGTSPETSSETAPETTPDSSSRDAVRVYNAFFLRAMNEGLADYWAWVYTGDTSFIEKSLPTETRRRLDKKVTQLRGLSELTMMTKTINGDLLDDEHLVGNAYTVGTDYARMMVELATQVSGGDVKSLEARRIGAKLLIQALPTVAEAAAGAMKARELLSPNILLKGLSLNMPTTMPTEASTKACGVVDRVAAFEVKSPLQGVKCAGADLQASVRSLIWDNVGKTSQ